MMNKLDKKLILNIVIMLTVCTTTKAMPISVGTDSVEKADSLPRRHHDLAMTLNKKTGDKVMAYLNMGFLGNSSPSTQQSNRFTSTLMLVTSRAASHGRFRWFSGLWNA